MGDGEADKDFVDRIDVLASGALRPLDPLDDTRWDACRALLWVEGGPDGVEPLEDRIPNRGVGTKEWTAFSFLRLEQWALKFLERIVGNALLREAAISFRPRVHCIRDGDDQGSERF